MSNNEAKNLLKKSFEYNNDDNSKKQRDEY